MEVDTLPEIGLQRVGTVVIGGGQTGLSVGYHLRRQGLDFAILDANDRIGDVWRSRWESLRLFTPALYNGLDGMRFPADPYHFPTKDEMADYLEAYADRFDLPVRSGVRVERVARDSDGFRVESARDSWRADHVVVAMSRYQQPWTPAFAGELHRDVVQIHSRDYKNPSQLREGDALIVGAGNSGAEIAMDVVSGHRTWVAGHGTGEVPFDVEGRFARAVGLRLALGAFFNHVLTLHTPMGRRMARKIRSHGLPLVRTRERNLREAGIERVGRIAGAREGRPLLEDGRTLEVANVVWCTGFSPDFSSWIDVPVLDEDGHPRENGGVVPEAPGLYFVGLPFQPRAASNMVQGIGRVASQVVDAIAARAA